MSVSYCPYTSQNFTFKLNSQDAVHTAVNSIGLIVNVGLMIHLLLHKVTSKKAQVIFQLQTVLDLLVCFVNLLNILQELFCFFPMTGWQPFDIVLCSWWHMGMMKWWLLVWSAHNLCFMAADRLLAVLLPLKYKLINKRWYYFAFFCCFVTSLATAAPWAAVDGVQNGECSASQVYYDLFSFNPVFLAVLSHTWSIMAFILPLFSLIVIYSLILWKLCAKRSESSTYSESTRRFTKTMLLVAAVFVATQTMPAVASYLEIADDVFSFWTKFLTGVYSASNPFIFFGEHFLHKIKSGQGISCWGQSVLPPDKSNKTLEERDEQN